MPAKRGHGVISEPRSSYVDTRRIGKADISIICDGSFYWAPEIQAPESEWRVAMPEANEKGELTREVPHSATSAATVVVSASPVSVALSVNRPSRAVSNAAWRIGIVVRVGATKRTTYR